MHAERDYLVRFVFPELRERCARRKLHMVDVDLRWGVTEAQSEQGLALEICLDEIERCRPFFIGLLGQRYGWIPPAYQVTDEAPYDWMREFEPGHSITALEIYYGVLRSQAAPKRGLFGFRKPSGAARAFFYFRQPGFLAAVPDAQQAVFQPESREAAEKLKRLKAAIRARCPVYDYPCTYAGLDADGRALTGGLEALGERVLEDIWAAICAEHPETAAPPDELSAERAYHEAFLESRTRRFLGRAKPLADMTSYAQGDDPTPLVITGAPGSGKSTLMARFAQTYAQSHAQDLVLSHFIGAGPGSSDLRRTLVRLCRELARGLRSEPVPEDLDELRRAFPKLLGEAAGRRRAVLLLDAVDQLDDTHDAHALTWLPHFLPAGVRLIVSTLEGGCLEALRQRKPAPPEIDVGRLTQEEGRLIVRQTLAEYRKTLDNRPQNDQMGLLLGKGEAHNPLYLAVACEELRMFGEFERLTERIADLPDTLSALFEQVLERLEHDHGQELVHSALSLLACSHHGLLESELLDLLGGQAPLPRATWARLYRSIKSYLQQPGESGEGLLDFFHRRLTEAVRRRYLPGDAARQAGHRHLAGYFRHMADPAGDGGWRASFARGLDELPYQLAHAGLPADLRQILLDPSFLQARLEASGTQALIDDYELIHAPGLPFPAESRRSLERVQGALRLSAQALADDVRQLPGQLTGRLLAFEQPDIQSFLEQLMARLPYAWLRPRSGTLLRPDSRVVHSWKLFSVAPVARLLVSDDERTVAIVEGMETRFWDIRTGIEAGRGDVEPAFGGVDWASWRANLPPAHFADEDYHKFTWSVESPPGEVVVRCHVQRHGTGHYGGQYNVSYDNSVSIRRIAQPPAPPERAGGPKAPVVQQLQKRHHPARCPSESARHWRAAMRGEQGPMAEDRAGEVDLDTHKFCSECDPTAPLDESVPIERRRAEPSEPARQESETALPIHAAFRPERTNYLSSGLIAPAISRDGRLIVCGGLHGAVQAWDSASRAVRFAGTIGPGTIVALAPFPSLERVAILTIEGRLLIADISGDVPTDLPEALAGRPAEVYVSPSGERAVLCESNAPMTVWDTISGRRLHTCGLRPGVVALKQRISADLAISIATAHGEDMYDGWLLAGFDLVTGKALFEFESHTPSDRFGEPVLLEQVPGSSGPASTRHRYVRVPTWPEVLNERGTPMTGKTVWIDASSGQVLGDEPPGKLAVVPLAEARLSAENGTCLEIHQGGREVSVAIPALDKDAKGDRPSALRFLPDSQVHAGGISRDGSSVVIACESAVHCLGVVRRPSP